MAKLAIIWKKLNLNQCLIVFYLIYYVNNIVSFDFLRQNNETDFWLEQYKKNTLNKWHSHSNHTEKPRNHLSVAYS